MNCTEREILQYVEENDVKFVKLTFCDIFGRQKNISVVSSELKSAFSNGVVFDSSAVSGFMSANKSDLYLFPDPQTLSVLPWRPQSGRVISLLCDVKYPDGSFFESDVRRILREQVARLKEYSLECVIGTECEFYVFGTDENGEPTRPVDNAGYCDSAPADRCENIRREIIMSMENMSIAPLSSHHEKGAGQNEIDFTAAEPNAAARNLLYFKSAVKNVSRRSGLYATFMPKPLTDQIGSALHVNLSLSRFGKSIGSVPETEFFAEGILSRLSEITAFCNPTKNSFLRLGKDGAPSKAWWSVCDRRSAVRLPSGSSRIEVRTPDNTCNPFLLFALLLGAGMEGLNKKAALRPQGESGDTLPGTLEKAVDIAGRSEFVRSILGDKTTDNFLQAITKERIGKDDDGTEIARYTDL